MGEFRMPSLGADMEHGTVIEWRVKPGDAVHRGDVVALVDTEKSEIEVEIFESGVVDRIVVPEGEEVPVGAVLAVLRAESAAAAEPAPPVIPAAPAPVLAAPPAPVLPAPAAPVLPAPAAPVIAAPPAPVLATPPAPVPAVPPAAVPPAGATPARTSSPVVRRLARQLGVDLETVTASGRGGRITRADVEAVAAGRAGRAAVAVAARTGPPRSSPYARRRAGELGVDLAAVTGSGPGGAIVARDVEGAHAAPASAAPAPTPPAAAPAAPQPAARKSAADRQQAMRHAIAMLMERSKREIPHYYLSTTIDLSRAMAWLRDRNASLPVTERMLPPVLLLKATALAARDVPGVNGFWIDGAFQRADHVHVGVAISLRGGGLVAPALLDTDTADLDSLMGRLRDLVNRARSGTLRSSEMSAPTITVTNLGEQGVEAVYGVIYPPQVALVGFGAIVERPWAQDGLLGVRPLVTATFSGDHRAGDGHLGARFLTAIDKRLQEPERL